VVTRCVLVERLDLEDVVRSRGIDLFKTFAVYNYGYWFDGYRCYVHIDGVTIVGTLDARFAVYDCGSLTHDPDRLVRYVFGLDEDTTPFLRIAEEDPLLRLFAREFAGWRLRSSSLWWSLVVGICQQNASFRQGWKMLHSIVKIYARSIEVEGRKIPIAPSPRDVVEKPHLLAEARVGYRARTIEGIAKAFTEGLLDPIELSRKPYEEIETVLQSLRGVGSYTARLAIALSFRKYGRAPIDRWLRRIASRIYGIDEKNVDTFWHQRWGSWSALASIAVTITLDAEPLSRALERIERGELLPKENVVPSPYTMWRYDWG